MQQPANFLLILLVRVEAQYCTLPFENVLEVMRPQPVSTIPEVPQFILGVSLIRGAVVPVVDLSQLMASHKGEQPRRLVTLRIDTRVVAVAVSDVIGLRKLNAEVFKELPPLVAGAAASAIDTIGMLDAKLLLALRAARILPNDIWTAIETETPA